MWDQINGCAKHYRCSIAYYLMSYLSYSYQIFLDRAVDTPSHGKDVVDGFNAVQKQYLATCLRMRSTPEKHKIDSKRMRVEAMTEEGEVSFAEECKLLLDIRDEIGTKGDKKHAKREAKARLVPISLRRSSECLHYLAKLTYPFSVMASTRIQLL